VNNKTTSNVCSGRGKCKNSDICECDNGFGCINCEFNVCNNILSNSSVCFEMEIVLHQIIVFVKMVLLEHFVKIIVIVYIILKKWQII
jgi:hypothetical protein